MRKHLLIHSLSLTAALMLAGCQTTPKVEKIEDSADVSTEIGKLQQKVTAAQTEQQNVLAPDEFKKAEHYLNEANHDREKGESNKEILSSVEKGNAWLAKANELANDRKENFKEVLATRTKAIEAHAPDSAKTEFERADKRLATYTDANGSISLSLKDKQELLAFYTDAQIASLKNRHLGAAKSNLNQAEKEGAKKAVPDTYKEVQQNIQNAEVFIESNYYKAAEVAQMGKTAEDSSTRLLNLTREARTNENKTPEQIALEKEAAAQAAAAQIAASQAAAAAAGQAAAASQADAANASSQLSQEARQVEAYKLNEQRQAAVRAMFNPEEADVLRTGGNTVIRLKGLQYATGKSQLSANDYKLLAKAKDAIRTMGVTSVIVEGHTDSIGGSAKNQTISEARADAVKKYFQSTDALKNITIDSNGVGDQKPLTSNRTKLGRAQNRRVDLILKGQNADATAM